MVLMLLLYVAMTQRLNLLVIFNSVTCRAQTTLAAAEAMALALVCIYLEKKCG